VRCPFPPIELPSWLQESFDLPDLGRRVAPIPAPRRDLAGNGTRLSFQPVPETAYVGVTIIRGGTNARRVPLEGNRGQGTKHAASTAIIEEREWLTRERLANRARPPADCETSVIPPLRCFSFFEPKEREREGEERVRSGETRLLICVCEIR